MSKIKASNHYHQDMSVSDLYEELYNRLEWTGAMALVVSTDGFRNWNDVIRLGYAQAMNHFTEEGVEILELMTKKYDEEINGNKEAS